MGIEGADIFCTTQPCILCAKMLINCRVRAIHFAEGYPDEMSRQMLDEAGIPYHVLERRSDAR